MSDSTFALACEDVGHRFGRRRLFAEISFTLDQPESVCIAGPNGSGKSTFLKILAGILRPTRGAATWTKGATPLPISRVRDALGFVSPDLQLYGELTAAENLTFFARLRRMDSPDRDWSEKLAELGLEGRGRDRVGNFSSGQRQRMKYLVATIHDPALLLLDEPTSNLDDAGRELVGALVSRHRERGILIVATNDKEEYRFGDRLVNLV